MKNIFVEAVKEIPDGDAIKNEDKRPIHIGVDKSSGPGI